MTRLSYFLYNLLLVCVIYTLAYFQYKAALIQGTKTDVLTYTLYYFSTPIIALNLFMALYSLVHFFMTHNHDIARDGITFLNASWFISLITFIAYKLISAGGILKLVAQLKGHG